MAVSDPINTGPSADDLLAVIQDFSQYLRFQKTLGFTRYDLSPQSRAILDTWGQKQKPTPSAPDFCFHGPASAAIVIVDSQGTFFSGEAGDLLKKILTAMKISVDGVSLCNASDPAAVKNHVQTVQPRFVIALGRRAAALVTGRQEPLENQRGRFFSFQGIKVMPTYHPLQLLENPALKRPVWEDMQQVMKIMESGHDR
ncbi:MAG TPA: uracil-DNA glycosylase [Desulfotignum sp.]|nr:uracil-DNA glycosylase [Desulfotignum sp.]